MTYSDLHVHTRYCDGNDSVEDLVKTAIKLNMKTLGVVVHSYTYFDESYCVKKEMVKAFQQEVKELKEKYKDKITLLCGVEQDVFSTASTKGFDYIIGSVHYLNKNGTFFAIDESKEILKNAINTLYDGDVYALVKDYYLTVEKIIENTSADIIGHFDIIKKYNKDNLLFDENDERYISCAKKAVDKLIAFNKPFEINTGALNRAKLKEPYPSKFIIDYIKQKGGKLLLSSDSHKKETLTYLFDNFLDEI